MYPATIEMKSTDVFLYMFLDTEKDSVVDLHLRYSPTPMFSIKCLPILIHSVYSGTEHNQVAKQKMKKHNIFIVYDLVLKSCA